jgi:hypothetical protein
LPLIRTAQAAEPGLELTPERVAELIVAAETTDMR